MQSHLRVVGVVFIACAGLIGGCSQNLHRFRLPAPAEDADPLIEEPVFGRSAGHERTDAALQPVFSIARRTWYVLRMSCNRTDLGSSPESRVEYRDGWVQVERTVIDGGVPLRNQVITCELEQLDEPILVLLRSADAFGDILLQIDFPKGTAWSRLVTINRSLTGADCTPSPRPEYAFDRLISASRFPPLASQRLRLKIRTQGERVRIWANEQEIFSFSDPDPAGGRFGFGSTGRMRLRDVQQWELITRRERERRRACITEMYRFCKDIDRGYDDDVRQRNQVGVEAGELLWTWRKTGATARLRIQGPHVAASVRSGLYGNDLLLEGVFPEITMTSVDGETYTADPDRQAIVNGGGLEVKIALPLRSRSGKTAVAHATARFTVQTVWFWTVTVEGAAPDVVRAELVVQPSLSMGTPCTPPASSLESGSMSPAGKDVLRHNAKSGFYVKAIDPDKTSVGLGPDGRIAIIARDARLRFATVVLPAQPLNLVGFKHRMVHYIRYPEGPVQQWRRRPSFQEYPDNVDLGRFASQGTDAMVWHHTWVHSDFRDREGFVVNEPEMKRAMLETHRLGMKTICYLGIEPGRSSLLRYEDMCQNGGAPGWGSYDKNWDLQDQTFYHVAGRYPEFLAWMTDYWCKEYGIDGFYLDGGALGILSRGPTRGALHPEDEGLSLDELQHRSYYRICKVLEHNRAGYGLEPWSGLNWMLNGFYDCMMIGESFQEADPAYYRDGYNALLTGCMIKMYGMRESSQNPYNVAMAAVNLSDIQVCSGNGAWGNDPDTRATWARVRPLWDVLKSIDWEHLVDARPWYAQELVSGDGLYAANYTTPRRAVVFLANKTEVGGRFEVTIHRDRLPAQVSRWRLRYCLGRSGDIGVLGDGRLAIELPPLHRGPVGMELVAEP